MPEIKSSNQSVRTSLLTLQLQWPYSLHILSPANPNSLHQSLDQLLERFSPAFRQALFDTAGRETSPEKIRDFQEYSMSMDKEFALWPARQPHLWRPKTLSFLPRAGMGGFLRGLHSSPNRLDTYYDRKLSLNTDIPHPKRIGLWTSSNNMVLSSQSMSAQFGMPTANPVSPF